MSSVSSTTSIDSSDTSCDSDLAEGRMSGHRRVRSRSRLHEDSRVTEIYRTGFHPKEVSSSTSATTTDSTTSSTSSSTPSSTTSTNEPVQKPVTREQMQAILRSRIERISHEDLRAHRYQITPQQLQFVISTLSEECFPPLLEGLSETELEAVAPFLGPKYLYAAARILGVKECRVIAKGLDTYQKARVFALAMPFKKFKSTFNRAQLPFLTLVGNGLVTRLEWMMREYTRERVPLLKPEFAKEFVEADEKLEAATGRQSPTWEKISRKQLDLMYKDYRISKEMRAALDEGKLPDHTKNMTTVEPTEETTNFLAIYGQIEEILARLDYIRALTAKIAGKRARKGEPDGVENRQSLLSVDQTPFFVHARGRDIGLKRVRHEIDVTYETTSSTTTTTSSSTGSSSSTSDDIDIQAEVVRLRKLNARDLRAQVNSIPETVFISLLPSLGKKKMRAIMSASDMLHLDAMAAHCTVKQLRWGAQDLCSLEQILRLMQLLPLAKIQKVFSRKQLFFLIRSHYCLGTQLNAVITHWLTHRLQAQPQAVREEIAREHRLSQTFPRNHREAYTRYLRIVCRHIVRDHAKYKKKGDFVKGHVHPSHSQATILLDKILWIEKLVHSVALG